MRHLPILPILFALLAITACTDDLGLTGPGAVTRDIRFNATVGDQWGKASRSGEIATPIAPGFEKVTEYKRFEMKSTTSDRPLYLHSETTDWDSPATPDTLPSRSNVVTNPTNLPSKIAVSAFHYTGAWTAASPKADFNFATWHPATGTNGNYILTPSLYWPSEGKMRFVAVAPADAPQVELNPSNWGVSPNLFVKVHPTDVSQHRDLLVAYTPERECTGSKLPVNLHFKHIMTGIRFKIADDMVSCRIKRIVIKGVPRQARFYFNTDNGPLLADPNGATSSTSQIYEGWGANWYDPGDIGDVEQTFDYDTSTATNPTINPGSQTFMLFPQWIEDRREKAVEVQIYLVQNIGGQDTEELIYGYIQGQLWSPGKIVTYTVSYRNWGGSMRVSEPEIFSHKGGSATLSMRNYIYAGTDNKEKRPVKWKATFCPSGSNAYSDLPPEWLQINYNNTLISSTSGKIFEGSGSIAEENFQVTVASTPVSRTYDLDKILYETAGQPKDNPLNLACRSDSLNDFTLYPWSQDKTLSGSANCYVCDRPGYYMFPLVYGNSIKEGGGDNYDAFRDPTLPEGSSIIEEDGVIRQIINHEGKPITSPYINKVVDMSDLSKFHGEVVWEDRPCLVNDIEIVPNAYGTGKHGVRFCVVKDPNYSNIWWGEGVSMDRVQQGNAVIAIKDYRAYDNLEDAYYAEEEIPAVWSWHIWVTPILNYERRTVRLHNHLNRRFDMLPVNIGWVSYNPIEFYDPRSCKIRFTGTFEGQDEVGNPKTHTIEREITIEQRRCFHYWHGHSTFFQWGRKDPFHGGKYMQKAGSTIVGTNVFWWTRDYSYYDGKWNESISMHRDQNPPTKLFPIGLDGITQRIRYPNSWDSTEDVFDPGSSIPKGLDKVPFNLWDAGNLTGYVPPTGSLPVVEIQAKKTVYDPSPRGFKVPPISAFTGFTKTGTNVTTVDGTADEFQGWNGSVETYTHTYDDTPYGGVKATLTSHVMVLFTDRTKRNVITIPMQGYRDWRKYPSLMGGDESSALYQLGTDAYLWTSQCYTQDRSYYASFMYGRPGAGHKGELFPLNYYWHLDGFNVRPCTEVYYPVPVQ